MAEALGDMAEATPNTQEADNLTIEALLLDDARDECVYPVARKFSDLLTCGGGVYEPELAPPLYEPEI